MIRNASKQTLVAQDVRRCESSLSKAKGLMFSHKIEKPLLFVFKREARYSLHMMFVSFPIDVIFVSKEKKVVDLKSEFKPFSFYKPKEKCMYIIECAVGVIDQSKTEVGDQLDFENV